ALAWVPDMTGDGMPELLIGKHAYTQNAGIAILVQICQGVTTYCTPKVSSQGCEAVLQAPGPVSVGGSPLVVSATQVPNQSMGIAFWGKTPLQQPLFGGFLCVLPPLRRSAPTFSGGSGPPPSDCSGELQFPI